MRLFRATWVGLKAAIAVLAENRWRSVATLAVCGLGTAGVMIAGVLAEVNLGGMRDQLDALGGNLIVISPNKLPPFPGRPRQLEHFISLEAEDATGIEELIPGARAVPAAARQTTIRAENRTSRVRLIGTTPDYLRVRNFTVERGRFISGEDERSRVIVLGYAVSRELLPQGVAPGTTVLLGNDPYVVVGTLASQGVNFAGEDEDHQAFVPLATYQHRIANRLWLSYLYVQLPPQAESAAFAKRVLVNLRARHGRWDYQADDVLVRDLSDLAAQQSELLTTVVWVVSVTSGLLLVMGAVGVTTLMMLVVRLRRPEIGLRRALGATPLDIGFQFLVESVLLAGVGVSLGGALGAMGAAVANLFLEANVSAISSVALAGIAISACVSIAACLVPALAAARLEPSAALRS